VYLYGVSRGLDLVALGDIAGVAGEPVRGVDSDGLTALVSTVRLDEFGEQALRANLENLGWLEATARAHHDVVDRAAHAAPTAPVRITTVYRDDDRVLQVLREGRERFGLVLDRITGRSEWGVKAYAYPDQTRPEDPGGAEAATHASTPSTAGGAAEGVGTAYLRRRQEQRHRREDAGRRAAEQAEALHAELEGRAVAVRQHPPQDPSLSGHAGTLVLNMAYLLDNEQVEEFLAVVRDIDGRTPGIDVEVTGPWPPYSFIDTDETSSGDSSKDER
jgi:hypothetical protein